MEEMGGWLRVEIRHNPLAMHRSALDAAVATRAAQRQGRFWEYHDRLLASPRQDRGTLIRLAAEAGCEPDAFLRDFEQAAVRDTVLADIEAAAKAGAQATPGFLINGHTEAGWASYEWIRQVVLRYRRGAGPSSTRTRGAVNPG